MIICIFNRREVRVTRNLKELEQVKACLVQNNVDCITRTNSISNPGRSHGFPNIKAASAYEYRVYVHKRDYSKATLILQKELNQMVF